LVKQLPKTGELNPKPQNPHKMGFKTPKPLTGLGVDTLKNYLKNPGWFGS
jgi:hypothetical protein